jgi:capsular exopolysaccharide synthesis family protein
MSQIDATWDDSGIDIREYLGVLARHKIIILFFTLVGVGGALFYSFSQIPLYKSDAKVLVKAVPVRSTGFATIPNLETEKELISSQSVRDLAEEELEEADETGELSVQVAVETEILVIEYTHPDPLSAQRGAQAFATAYLDYRRQQFIDDLLSGSETIQARVRALNARLDVLNEQIEEENNQAALTSMQAQANALIGQVAILQQQLTELTPPERLRVGQVVERASLPSAPFKPDHLTNGLLGLLAGLALGVGGAFARERIDDRLRGKEDLEERVGAPVLAIVPHVSTWRRRKEPLLISLEEPRSGASEAYRTLRMGVLFASTQRKAKKILITSAQAGEGKTATASNLGVVLAQANKRVIIVSADVRKPRLSSFFEAPAEPGLTNVIAGDASVWDCLHNPGIPNLRILPSGPIPGNPSELLGSEAMRDMLAKLSSAADFILIDGPPILALADAGTLAPQADVVLIADADHTSRSAIEHARQQLDRVNAVIIGAVLNNLDPTASSGYEYRYQYYRSSYYQEEGAGSQTGSKVAATDRQKRKDKSEKQRRWRSRGEKRSNTSN